MTGDEYTKVRKDLLAWQDTITKTLAFIDEIYQLGYDEGYTDGEHMASDE